MDEPGQDHKRRIRRKSNLHSRFEAKKSGAGAVMKILMKIPNVPLFPFLLSSINLSSSSLSTLEHSTFVHRPRSAYQPFPFLSDPPPLKLRFSTLILLSSTLFAIGLLPNTKLAPPFSITARVTPTPTPMSSTLFGTPTPHSYLTTHP